MSRHFKSVSVSEVANASWKCGLMYVSVVLAIASWRVPFHVGVTKVSRRIKLVSVRECFQYCLEVCVYIYMHLSAEIDDCLP